MRGPRDADAERFIVGAVVVGVGAGAGEGAAAAPIVAANTFTGCKGDERNIHTHAGEGHGATGGVPQTLAILDARGGRICRGRGAGAGARTGG